MNVETFIVLLRNIFLNISCGDIVFFWEDLYCIYASHYCPIWYLLPDMSHDPWSGGNPYLNTKYKVQSKKWRNNFLWCSDERTFWWDSIWDYCWERRVGWSIIAIWDTRYWSWLSHSDTSWADWVIRSTTYYGTESYYPAKNNQNPRRNRETSWKSEN